MPFISVVTPVYNASGILDELHKQLTDELKKLTDDYEIIMVNDGCPYGSGIVARQIAARDEKVKFIGLSRNFGQHVAISAGLDYAEGDYVFVMDCDLQDPPEEMGAMLGALQKSNSDICFGIRKFRNEGKRKIWLSDMFRSALLMLADRTFICRHSIGNFSVITRKVVMAFRRVREPNRSYAGILLWLGFRKMFYQYESRGRFAGSSGYTFWKSMKLAGRIVLQSSIRPLYISACCAAITAMGALGMSMFVIWRWLVASVLPTGWTSMMLVMLYLFAALFLVLTVLCVYVANLFVEIHRRPLYAIAETYNLYHHREKHD